LEIKTSTIAYSADAAYLPGGGGSGGGGGGIDYIDYVTGIGTPIQSTGIQCASPAHAHLQFSTAIDSIDYVPGIEMGARQRHSSCSSCYARSAQLLPSLGTLSSFLHPLLGPYP
jgi:hypothetical protein